MSRLNFKFSSVFMGFRIPKNPKSELLNLSSFVSKQSSQEHHELMQRRKKNMKTNTKTNICSIIKHGFVTVSLFFFSFFFLTSSADVIYHAQDKFLKGERVREWTKESFKKA